jgi:hypothetical protein
VHAALLGLGAGSPLVLVLALLSARRAWTALLVIVALLSRNPDRRRTALEVLRLTGNRPDKTRSYLPPPGDS